MTTRVELAPGVAAVFVVAVLVLAAGAVAIGLMMALGAGRITAAQPQMSLVGLIVGGGLLVIAGGAMVRWAVASLRAVALIVVEDDRAWTLRSRAGRVVGTVAAGQDRQLRLRGYRVFLVAAAVPRRQDVVSGRLVAGGRELRLAESGPVTYDRALRALGYPQAAPRPGQQLAL